MSNEVFVAVGDSDENGNPELADSLGTDSTKLGTMVASSVAVFG